MSHIIEQVRGSGTDGPLVDGEDGGCHNDLTAEDLIVGRSQRRFPRMRFRRLIWDARKSPAKKIKRDQPSREVQILRTLATLTALVPDDGEVGYSVPQILAFGLGLYPDSRLFSESDDGLVVPTTKHLVALLRSEKPNGLVLAGDIERLAPAVRMKSAAKKRFRVRLTLQGAKKALEGGWLPPSAFMFQTWMIAAQRRLTLGVVKLA